MRCGELITILFTGLLLISLVPPSGWTRGCSVSFLNKSIASPYFLASQPWFSPSAASSPAMPSSQQIAYVTNISSLAHWQKLTASQVNTTHQLDLLTTLTGYSSRHPFVTDGNLSLDWLEGELLSIGLNTLNDEFSIHRLEWNGTSYANHNYWTRNLYVCPWTINSSQPSLIITCQVDSARNTLLGLDPTNAPGANDNAAGVVAVFEAVQVLSTHPGHFSNCNIIFAFLNGEEGNGTLSLWGSTHLVTTGFSLLGINPATSIVLNIDEIAYPGMILPSEVALYKYAEDDISSLLPIVKNAGNLLDITLIEEEDPRVASNEELQNPLAWGISEWTFHSFGIPSLTLSTDQYPDPFKHTTSDTPGRCSLTHIRNVTQLLIATILGLTYEVPESPINFAEEWMPPLNEFADIVLVDYLNYTATNFSLQILDPALSTTQSFLDVLSYTMIPTLALGQAGAYLLQNLTSIAISSDYMQTLQVYDLKELHPAIQSPYLLSGTAKQLFSQAPLVYAISPLESFLVLVGNSSWTSMCYVTNLPEISPLLFIGINHPLTQAHSNVVKASISWLLENTSEGLSLGVDSTNLQPGTTMNLYILAYDYLTWTGLAHHHIELNITTLSNGDNQIQSLVTNNEGIATVPLRIQTPHPVKITAHSPPNLTGYYYLEPSAACHATFIAPSSAFQGETLSIRCEVTSFKEAPLYVNLTFTSLQDEIYNQTNVLLLPGLNHIQAQLPIRPNYPPATENFTLILSSTNFILLIQHFEITIRQAFEIHFETVPTAILQQELFEALLSITNYGNQFHSITLRAASNFIGSYSFALPHNSTVHQAITLYYAPVQLMDVGQRWLTIELWIDSYIVTTCHTQINVQASSLNVLFTFIPPSFLILISLLGVCMIRRSSQIRGLIHRRQKPSKPQSPISRNKDLIWQPPFSLRHSQRYPYSQALVTAIKQLGHRIGFVPKGNQRFFSQQAALMYEIQGETLELTIFASSPQTLQHLSALLTTLNKPQTQEGET